MSILIKGMEMPTDHPMWIIVHSDGTVETNEVSASRPVGWQTLRNAAVPVPPHGRLGDLDALMDQIVHDTPLSDVFEKTMRRYLHNAPTIIPAEEAAAKDIDVPSKPYDLLYEEGGLGIR